jgi:predicted nucleic acid-binding Zn ribbon protein
MTTSPEASKSLHLLNGHVDQSLNEEALEEQDQLPSLPSTSSSLFIASNYRSPQSQYGSSTRRKASLYGNPSIATSDAISIEGCSTFEYDINSNIHKQQVRRRRGGSNASISTVASVLSRNASIADSMQSYNHNYASSSRYAYDGDEDRHSVIAHGQFISNQSATSSIRRGGGGNESNENNKSAAASLRKIGRASGIDAKFLDSLRRENAEEVGEGKQQQQQPTGAHLTDKLEQLIANSASYRSANSRFTPSSHHDSSFNQRQRKNSYASMRSLIGFTSTNQRQTGDYRATGGTPSRTASLFGLFIGGGGGNTDNNQSNNADTLRSPAWSKRPSAMAPILTSTHSGTTSVPTSPTLTQSPRDAMGSLRGLRGLFDDPNNATTPRTRTMSAMSRPPIGTMSKASSNAEGKRPERKRNVSFQSPTEFRSNLPSSTSSAGRRAFASIDPTSGVQASGASTPHTSRSISPPLINSRAESQLDLPSLTASATSSSSGLHTSESGAMPALDAALARAEERSGLKTSSKCSTCGLKVVNAPMTKSGEVFCSRDCRILAKQKRKQASAAAAASTTTVPSAKITLETESKKIVEPVKEAQINPVETTKQSIKTAEIVPPSEAAMKKSTDSSSVHEPTFSPNLRSSQTLHSSRPASIATTRSASSTKYINTDVDDLRAVRAQTSKPLMQAVS